MCRITDIYSTCEICGTTYFKNRTTKECKSQKKKGICDQMKKTNNRTWTKECENCRTDENLKEEVFPGEMILVGNNKLLNEELLISYTNAREDCKGMEKLPLYSQIIKQKRYYEESAEILERYDNEMKEEMANIKENLKELENNINEINEVKKKMNDMLKIIDKNGPLKTQDSHIF